MVLRLGDRLGEESDDDDDNDSYEGYTSSEDEDDNDVDADTISEEWLVDDVLVDHGRKPSREEVEECHLYRTMQEAESARSMDYWKRR
jgi:hypothetical protein